DDVRTRRGSRQSGKLTGGIRNAIGLPGSGSGGPLFARRVWREHAPAEHDAPCDGRALHDDRGRSDTETLRHDLPPAPRARSSGAKARATPKRSARGHARNTAFLTGRMTGRSPVEAEVQIRSAV